MPRLIDADALMERLTKKKAKTGKARYTEGYNDALLVFRSMVHREPSVEAVPKSKFDKALAEIERMEKIIDDGAETCHNCHEKYAKRIKTSKDDTARELFEELDRLLKEASVDAVEYPALYSGLAEIEKKYMGGRQALKVLELFAGTRSIGKAFEARGHEVYSVEWDKSFDNIDLYADIGTLTVKDFQDFGLPDVVWASFDCATFSIAAISHHRRKNPETGNLDPVSDYAKFCDKVDQHVLALIEEIQQERERQGLQPALFFIENPRGGLRKMTWMQGLPRYTVTYCQYGDTRMKPTDIWTNHRAPNFKPMCKNGDPCHVSAPRGAKTGTQGLKGSKERSRIPALLCEHIVAICEQYHEEEDAWMQ